MAGFTPFQFSSKMLQEKTTSGLLGGISFKGTFADMLHSAFSWYEMWINPEKVNISSSYIQKPQHTAGSIVTYHYRQETPKMSVSGQCGWVLRQSQKKSNQLWNFNVREGTDDSKPWYKRGWNVNSDFNKRNLKDRLGTNAPPVRVGASDNFDNSPREFLSRLKEIADEPMYFLDAMGVEHCNIKFIKIYTKQFPEGVICEGYYTKFDIPEEAGDAQTIAYSFEFTIERITPISFLDKKLSMLGDKAKGVGSMLRSGF